MAAEWGLQAIIRPKHQQYDDNNCFGSIDIKKEYDQALLFCYPHLFDDQHNHVATTATMEETKPNYVTDDDDHHHHSNQLYNNPFYQPPPPPPPPPPATADVQINHHHHHYNESNDLEIQRDQDQEIKNFTGSAASNTSQLIAPKLKKRKNQQKRVVAQVTAAGLSSDPWAWRKYGQKPIKGSIYPRSYYRCSSSKGCMARRQVEQSCNDSSIYILTYTGEHNHPQPTRRNSLAGINRNHRFKATPKTSPTNSDVGKTVTKSKGSSPFDHSPPLTISASSSMEDEVVLQQSNFKEETTFYNKCDDINDQGHSTMMMMPEINDDYMVFSDDFFEGLEDLGGYKTEESSSYNYSSTKQFPHVFC